MAKKEICKICGKEITGTVVDEADGSVTCVTCYNLEVEKNKPVSDIKLDELITMHEFYVSGCDVRTRQYKEYTAELSAFKELKIYRLQRKKRDLMIRKAQLLKQNKVLLEKQKEGKK